MKTGFPLNRRAFRTSLSLQLRRNNFGARPNVRPRRYCRLTAGLFAVLATLGYGAAALAYIVHFLARRREHETAGALSLLVYAALAFHTAWIVAAHLDLGYLPIATASQSLSLVAWGIALAYVIIEFEGEHRGFGAFIMPVAFVLQAAATAFLLTRPQPEALKPILQSVWFELHVGTALFSYCAFAIAFAAGLMHILLNHELRLKRLRFFFTRMPPLHVLERINRQAIALGFLFLTIGIGSGVIWLLTTPGLPLSDPKPVSTLIVWLLYAANIHLRWRMGWRGQRSAIFSVVNFMFLLAIFFVTSFVLGAHQF